MVYANVEEANNAVISKIIAGSPFLLDVVPAKEVIDAFNHGKVLLHAGPPITYDKMIDPVQGACIGAAIFEGWLIMKTMPALDGERRSQADPMSPCGCGWSHGWDYVC